MAVIHLDRERQFSITLNAGMRYEEAFGGSFFADLDKVAATPSATLLARIIWAGLSEHDPDIRVEDVARMIGMANLRAVIDAIAAEAQAAGNPPEQTTGEP